jgi:DNA-directed RNA polymerase subunit M/transcription elongation factor TFIIS
MSGVILPLGLQGDQGQFQADMEGQIINLLTSLPPIVVYPSKSYPVITGGEAIQLASIKTHHNKYLFDLTQIDNFYQLVSVVTTMKFGKESITRNSRDIDEEIDEQRANKVTDQTIKMGFDQAIKYLNSLTWIFSEEAVHESPLLDHVRINIELSLLDEEQEAIVEEGATVCVRPGCGSRRITRTMVQKRAADEPATLYQTCTECGKNWKIG